MQLKKIVNIFPKSKIKAGEGKNSGKYPLFTCSPEINKYLDDFQINNESIIVGTGGNAVINYYNGPLNYSTDCLVFSGNNEYMTKYIYYYLLFIIDDIEDMFRGAGLKHLNRKEFMNIDIPQKNLDEQKEIIQKLDSINVIINSYLENKELLKKIRKNRFAKLFLTDKGFSKLKLEEFCLNDKYSIKRGPFGGSLKKSDFKDEGFLVYEQRHAIHEDFEYEKYYIDEKKYNEMNMFRVIPGDLIISCSGVTLGRIAEIPVNAKPGIINQALLKLSLNNDVMNNKFFIDLFRSDNIQDVLFDASRGAGIPNFPSMVEIKNIDFICPPIELQNDYCFFAETVDKLQSLIDNQILSLRKLAKSTMNFIFDN